MNDASLAGTGNATYRRCRFATDEQFSYAVTAILEYFRTSSGQAWLSQHRSIVIYSTRALAWVPALYFSPAAWLACQGGRLHLPLPEDVPRSELPRRLKVVLGYPPDPTG